MNAVTEQEVGKKKLYKFELDCGRMGWIDSVFIATDEEMAAAMGQYVYFGEALGKHSEITTHLDPSQLTVLSDDQEFVAKLEGMGFLPTGHHPLSCIDPAYEEDEEE